ncbi:histidine phosphatase family protein [Paenibacillus elgii]|uniref:histidine phosphatase family protein n=1 Tax=Paenibacillus elgii TaxID=189691 RepID=UPI001CB9393E|nr:histidine phosphatase family protein [Paenibacillus elgii]
MSRIETNVYFVRHAESLYITGEERSRGLTERGRVDAITVKDILLHEPVDLLISSPYERAVLTIRELADHLRKEIVPEEDLRERQLSGGDFFLPNDRFIQSKKQLYDDPTFAFPGGESSEQAQERAVKVLARYLEQYSGRSIVVGTHGDIMTLMLNYFVPSYHFDFWESTTMPDIYKLEFQGKALSNVMRLWK